LNRIVIPPDWRIAISRGIFWGLHDLFEFCVGNGKNAGRRRVAARLDVFGASVIAGLLLSMAGIRLANRF